jgi:prophage tail gpP-like protein
MPNKDLVQLFIGNETQSGRMTDIQDYSANVKNYEISYDLFTGAGSFNASLDTRISVSLYQKPLKFMWKINGIIMMTGYIDKKEFSYSKGSLTQTLSGRDMMQVLLDNFVLYPQPYEGKTLKYIIEDVWSNPALFRR